MSSRTQHLLHLLLWAAVFIAIPIVSGGYSLILGMDTNWDLRNYHYYVPYAFLNNRLDTDLAPGQMQSYLNPLPDIPFYYMVRTFPARTVGFILGVVHGLNLSLVLGIFLLVVRRLTLEWKLLLGALVVVLAAFSPMFVAELGTTFNDNLTSIFVFAGLILLLLSGRSFNAEKRRSGFILVAISGLVIGMGVGLKIVAFPFAVGAALAMPFLFRDRRLWPPTLLFFFLAGAAGVLVTGGFWFLEMWERFRNPIFPFFNNLFPTESTISVKSSIRARPLVRLLLMPLLMDRFPLTVAQVKFVDIRMFVGFLLSLIWIVILILRRYTDDVAVVHRRAANFIFVFFWVSFYTWFFLFPIYRYLTALDVIFPVLLFLLTTRIIRPPQAGIQAVLILTAVILAVFNPPTWGRLGWTERYFMVEPRSITIEPGSIVIMLGSSPTGFVVPDLPPTAAYLRVDGNMALSPGDPFFERVLETIDEHDGEIYLLYNREENESRMYQVLPQFGLPANPDRCDQLVNNHLQDIIVCEISKK